MYRLNYEKKDLGQSYAVVVATMIVSSLLLGLIFGINATGWKFWLMQALYTLLIGGSAFLYAAATKTKVFVATRLNAKPGYQHVLWGCVAVTFLIACMTPINNALLDGIEALGLKRPSVELENNLAGLLVVACLLPSFCEELIFRGTVAQSLSESNNRLAALSISGALFAIFHANPAQTVHQFVLGAFLTLLVFRSGSLWTSVIVHFFNNTLVVILSYTALGKEEFWSFRSNTGIVVTLVCVGIVGFAASIFCYLKTTQSVWHCRDVASGEESVFHSSSQGDVVETTQAMSENSAKTNPVSLVMLVVTVVICVALWATNLFAV